MLFRIVQRAQHYAGNFLQKQQQRNYQSEYDRIRSHVEDSATPSLNKDHLKGKMARLKALGAKAVDSIN